ncbi:IS66 family insertion sequence element accessory protein TnpB [Aminipila sp.]|uniref:IS66 family insertion sequence element accessory protein TnpB n=1 Tax=Aminipila sp. TaxID=2060095 RepID=UPI00289F136C|nr:IS66 family insertion sequence element accessory protein TnpB [Aminipila sp.]
MIGDISMATNIYVITGYTDMRKSLDGLYALVVDKLNEEPNKFSIYLFCGKRADRIKILLRESDGYVILYKRLNPDVQGRFRWPRNTFEVKSITWKQLDWLMSGLEIEQPKALKIPQNL